MTKTLFSLSLLALAACATSDPAACGAGSADGGTTGCPVTAVAVTFDVQAQLFKLAQVRLNTLTSLRHLEGTAGNVAAGGVVEVRSAAVLQPTATVASLRQQFIQVAPSQVDLTWNILNDTVYPEDFASLELLSTYYNMEKARSLLALYGLDTLPSLPVAAHASIEDEKGLSPLAQGEMYYAPLATFYPPKATKPGQVPAALNLGAVAHALGHEAVEIEVWGGTPVPAPELLGSDATSLTAKHVARSMTEGLSDYLGAAISGDEGWFSHTEVVDAPARTLDQTRCGTPDMLDALTVDDGKTPYDPYPLGSVIASLLFDEGASTTQQNTARGVIAALPALAARLGGGVTLGAVLDTLAANSPADQKPDLCGMILNRFAALGIASANVPSCNTATPHSECR